MRVKLFQKRLYYRVLLVLRNSFPKRPLAPAWASSWSCRHLSWAPLNWQLVVGSWVGSEKARNSGATGLTPAVALRLGICFAIKTARLFLALLWKFQETAVIVLSGREVLFQCISPCLHRLLVCFFTSAWWSKGLPKLLTVCSWNLEGWLRNNPSKLFPMCHIWSIFPVPLHEHCLDLLVWLAIQTHFH